MLCKKLEIHTFDANGKVCYIFSSTVEGIKWLEEKLEKLAKLESQK